MLKVDIRGLRELYECDDEFFVSYVENVLEEVSATNREERRLAEAGM